MNLRNIFSFPLRHWPCFVLSAALLALLIVAMNLWVCHSAAAYCYPRLADVPARPVAIVLGALVHSDGTPSGMLEDRLQTALELYRAGRVKKIIVSGDHGRTAYDEVNVMRRWLQDRRVAPQDIFMDHAGFDTYNTMARARQVFGVDSAIVVTQDFHLPRAVYLARAAGIDAVGLKADRFDYPNMWYHAVRESAARVKAFAEVQLRLPPHYLGPQIPITGDGRATWDEAKSSL
jgi:SanA protein